jgi:hypothetical protein
MRLKPERIPTSKAIGIVRERIDGMRRTNRDVIIIKENPLGANRSNNNNISLDVRINVAMRRLKKKGGDISLMR